MIETYASPEALSAHMGHVGHLLGPLFESGGSVDVNILGDAPEALIQATKDFQPTMYAPRQRIALPARRRTSRSRQPTSSGARRALNYRAAPASR